MRQRVLKGATRRVATSTSRVKCSERVRRSHAGECEVLGDKISGIAVHVGARVVATAGPGEVLVSNKRQRPRRRIGSRIGGSRQARAQWIARRKAALRRVGCRLISLPTLLADLTWYALGKLRGGRVLRLVCRDLARARLVCPLYRSPLHVARRPRVAVFRARAGSEHRGGAARGCDIPGRHHPPSQGRRRALLQLTQRGNKRQGEWRWH